MYFVRACSTIALIYEYLCPPFTRIWINSSIISILVSKSMSILVFFILLISSCRRELNTVSSERAVPFWSNILLFVGLVKCLYVSNPLLSTLIWMSNVGSILFTKSFWVSTVNCKKSITLFKLLHISSLVLSSSSLESGILGSYFQPPLDHHHPFLIG